MSSYGPPGGPRPGQEPWRDPRQQPAPYDSPTDPWGGGQPADPWGAQPTSVPPAGQPTSPPYGDTYAGYHQGHTQQQGYAQTPYPWDQPAQAQPAPTPPGNRRQTVLILTVVVLALLLGVGGFAAVVLTNNNGKPAGASTTPTPAASTGPSPAAGAGGQPVPASAGVPSSAVPSDDYRLVRSGQCVRNEGTAKDPKIRIVPCGANTFQVLKRIDGTADRARCAGTVGYTDYFFYDSPLNSLDFVLCLRRM